MKKHLKTLSLILIVILIFSLVLAGCSNSKTEKAENGNEEPEKVEETQTKHVFKLSNVFTPDQPLNIALEEVAENIKKRTNGAIEIQIYPNGEIAAYKDGVELVIRGAHFISNEDPSYIGDYVPEYKALVGPMLYETMEEYSAICQSDYAKEINKKAEEKGIKVLALDYCFGFRHIVANKAVKTPEDLKGVKLRVPKSDLWIDTLTAMGATPVPMAWSEVYSALQQGVIDGLETSISDVAANQLQEIVKHISLTGHFCGTTCIALSNEVWKTLTPEQQKIMEEEFAAGAIRNNEMVKEQEEQDRKMLEEAGVKFNEVDLEAFRKRAAVVFEKIPNLPDDTYEKIQEELAKIRKSK
ncbi:MAG: TRAP transporter substrate-binding protein DctP [Tepidanaerobacter acetatoxydans]|uniref:C4-dicarboxylate TRAP transporter substrate-binding protein n=1 Tax=Tepidanaerobacter acetatoxydans TaxID=499229 RepID=UPI0026F311D9|nr:C4-dicarboxylate TRAP transporter substrate-binding protein [Tepidanaerobacter acetatoxydans]NLU10068.1 TRAP transporter substrate-binding protein DctP [Tepidanaerobacter acetatoxydans]